MEGFAQVCTRLAYVECFVAGASVEELAKASEKTPSYVRSILIETVAWQQGSACPAWDKVLRHREQRVSEEVARLTEQPELFEEFIPRIVLERLGSGVGLLGRGSVQ